MSDIICLELQDYQSNRACFLCSKEDQQSLAIGIDAAAQWHKSQWQLFANEKQTELSTMQAREL